MPFVAARLEAHCLHALGFVAQLYKQRAVILAPEIIEGGFIHAYGVELTRPTRSNIGEIEVERLIAARVFVDVYALCRGIGGVGALIGHTLGYVQRERSVFVPADKSDRHILVDVGNYGNSVLSAVFAVSYSYRIGARTAEFRSGNGIAALAFGKPGLILAVL